VSERRTAFFIRARLKIVLKKSGIRLAAEDVGGETGRLIHFLWKDGSVYVRKVKKFANVRLAQRDAALWKKILENQEQGVSAGALWQKAVKGD
jgi:chemotaxis protein CheD